jgi:hypothetical protein
MTIKADAAAAGPMTERLPAEESTGAAACPLRAEFPFLRYSEVAMFLTCIDSLQQHK